MDKLIEENSFVNIYDNSSRLGQMIYNAILKSENDIICFLDDDDLFHKNKLERVAAVFTKYNPVMFHNSVLYFNNNNNLQLNSNYGNLINILDLKSAIRYSTFWNLSSICVNKTNIDLDILKKIDLTVDLFLFLTSYKYKKVIHDTSKLTYYRVSKLYNIHKYINKLLRYNNDFNLLKETFGDNDSEMLINYLVARNIINLFTLYYNNSEFFKNFLILIKHLKYIKSDKKDFLLNIFKIFIRIISINKKIYQKIYIYRYNKVIEYILFHQNL